MGKSVGCLSYRGVKVYIAEPRSYNVERKRSWKERLFSLPFKPFTKTVTETKFYETVEDDEFLRYGDKCICNNKTFSRLLKDIEEGW